LEQALSPRFGVGAFFGVVGCWGYGGAGGTKVKSKGRSVEGLLVGAAGAMVRILS